MPTNPVTVWASVADKLLGVLEKFLDPKQYDIVCLKRMKKALNVAEEEFETCEEILDWIALNDIPFDKTLKRLQKRHMQHKSSFNKYD